MLLKKYLNPISSFQFYQLARYATLMLTGVVFTKTLLTQKAIGEYEAFVFIAGAITFFWLNGLIKALLPLSSEKIRGNFFSAFVLIQLFSILVAAVLFLLQPVISEFLLSGRAIPEPGLLMLFIITGVPANLVEYFYLTHKKSKAILIYALISYIVQFFLIVAPAIINLGIEYSILGLVFSSLLRYMWLWILFFKNSEIHFNPSFAKENLKLGIPLIVATFLSGSAEYIDGFIVTSMFDEETFAIFRYGARELPLAILLANALNVALLPSFSNPENLSKNLVELKWNVKRLMHFIFPVSAILILISHPVFPFLFNPEFEKSATIFNIYMMLVVSRLIMPQTILNGVKHTKGILTASVLELILNVSLSLLLVRFLGINGVAAGTFFAFVFEKIYLHFILKRKLNIHLSQYLPIKLWLFYSSMLMLFFIFAELIF